MTIQCQILLWILTWYLVVVEWCPDKTPVDGSSPSFPTNGLVAQWIEHLTSNQMAAGSIPAGVTKNNY